MSNPFRSKLTNLAKPSNNNNKSNDDVEFLLKTIDEQNEKSARIESKFKELTAAYKSLLAEKKALEITVKALKTTTPANAALKAPQLTVKASSSTPLSASSRSVSQSDISEQDYSPNTSEAAAMSAASNSELALAEEKIASLTSNIQVLLDNKSAIEQSFLAEKKKLRSEIEDLKSRLEASKGETFKTSDNYETKIKELKESLKKSQLDRDRLVQDLNGMIKSKSADQESKALSISEETQTLLVNLRNENMDLKSKLKNLNKQFENKCEEVIQCERELKSLKSFHEQQSKQDEQQMRQLNEQLKDLSGSSEKRINDLEARISEMCITIANNENALKHTNRSSASRKLTDDDTFDLRAKYHSTADSKSSMPHDLDSAIEQISELKSFIESTARDLNINFNFNEIWLQSSNLSNTKQHNEQQKELLDQIDKLKEENKTIRDEFEKHKIRTNYLIKSVKQTPAAEATAAAAGTIAVNETDYQKQITKLKEELDLYKKRITLLERENQDEMKSLKQAHEESLVKVRNEYKLKLEKSENEKQKSIADLENELVKQRERTTKLLIEKDDELKQYREQSLDSNESTKLSQAQQNDDTTKRPDLLDECSNSGSEMTASTNSNKFNAKLMHSSNISNNNENHLIHYTQENAYKDIELNKLRLAKNELEYKLKQTFDEHSVDVERYEAQANILKQEIERLKLIQSRNELNSSGANLEYVKNVIFNFITAKDNNVKLAMINAIMQILQFSKNERQRIQSISNKL